MAISFRHAFTSGKIDGTDSTLIQPSNWNAEHTLTLAAGKVLGRDSSAGGAAQELAISVDSTVGQQALDRSQLLLECFAIILRCPRSKGSWAAFGAPLPV
jgi:hypothetical protein